MFVDTSAFLALLDADDEFHAKAVETWDRLIDGGVSLLTTNHVVVETNALVQRRLGMEALRALMVEVVRGLTVAWVDRETHEAAAAAQLVAHRKRLSLVDCVSFQVMRDLGLTHAFAHDVHFGHQGFSPA